VDGVFGKKIELLLGVPPLTGEDAADPDAKGKGTANGFRGEVRFVGDFVGERDGDVGV
jgi:hypothetical protein